jgi:septum formation protein
VLASRSPRRAELLRAAGFEFSVRVAEVDETPREGEAAREYVLRLAAEKARAVTADDDEIVLAADTTVVLGSEIMGKPRDEADAARMLRALAGQRHEVITGICLRRGVREPMDKAGAYGIQGLASRFIERIEGSYTNVVGLPVALTYRLLRSFSGL